MIVESLIRKYQDIFFYKVLERNLSNCFSVLDVGCGADSPLGKLGKTFYSEGIDIYKPSISKSIKKKIHDKYIVGNISKLDKFYKAKSFDAVIALDIIEHFKKKDALTLMKKMERVARKRIIILTPNGFYHQDHLDGNPHQEHKSGWRREDLERLGYKVYGLRGLKSIRGEHATIKYKPWIFWGFFSFISEPIFYFFPSYSYHLFAVKSFYE
ncbi:MAG: class I SAM-dependent methyltransferase [Patescibacteria group bacterium]|nr:class I SAM-dependent methyltransferase [Patescibacteria group bacterium]